MSVYVKNVANSSWQLEMPYAKGYRHAEKGGPRLNAGLQLGHSNIAQIDISIYNIQYERGYKAGQRSRLRNLLLK